MGSMDIVKVTASLKKNNLAKNREKSETLLSSYIVFVI